MQIQNYYLDDATRFFSSIINILSSVRKEAQGMINQQLEQILSKINLVSRDEVEILQTMIRIAHGNQEHLEQRLIVLEGLLHRDKKHRLTRRQAATNIRHRVHRVKRKGHDNSTSL